MSELVAAYLNANPTVEKLFGGRFGDKKFLSSRVDEALSRGFSAQNYQFLLASNKGLELGSAAKENLAALQRGKAVSVLFGQQLGLFGGPAFVLYKVVHALKLVEYYEREFSIKTVPIFWLQSEDHAIREINSAALVDSQGEFLNCEVEFSGGEKTPSAYQTYDQSIETALDKFSSSLSSSLEGKRVRSALRQAYAQGESPVSSFKQFIHSLFFDTGLLFFDPRTPGFNFSNREFFHRCFLERNEIEEALWKKNAEIEKAGFLPQVYIRKNSPLLVLHEEATFRRRFRVEERKGAQANRFFKIAGENSFSESEVIRILSDSREMFGATALLRPILQDMTFPTVAFVGGWAEIAYLVQSSAVYKYFSLSMPALFPRVSCCVLEDKVARWLEKSGLSPGEVIDGSWKDTLVGKSKLPPRDLLAQKASKSLSEVISLLEQAALSADPTLGKPLKKTEDKFQSALSTFLDKYEKAVLRKDTDSVARIERVLSYLEPQGKKQERLVSGAYFIAQYGKDFINRLNAAISEKGAIEVSGKEIYLCLSQMKVPDY